MDIIMIKLAEKENHADSIRSFVKSLSVGQLWCLQLLWILLWARATLSESEPENEVDNMDGKRKEIWYGAYLDVSWMLDERQVQTHSIPTG